MSTVAGWRNWTRAARRPRYLRNLNRNIPLNRDEEMRKWRRRIENRFAKIKELPGGCDALRQEGGRLQGPRKPGGRLNCAPKNSSESGSLADRPLLHAFNYSFVLPSNLANLALVPARARVDRFWYMRLLCFQADLALQPEMHGQSACELRTARGESGGWPFLSAGLAPAALAPVSLSHCHFAPLPESTPTRTLENPDHDQLPDLG